MRYSASEKYEIIQLVERSDLSVRKTLAHLDIHRSTFYNWLRRYGDEGVDGLNAHSANIRTSPMILLSINITDNLFAQ